MNVGVAIPCYDQHVKFIPILLDNISKQTIKPTHVVISCSSYYKDYCMNFIYEAMDITIKFTSKQLNQAANRNIAASMLNTDIISFFDCDDMMHPRRIEAILQAFTLTTKDVFYHGYSYETSDHRLDTFPEIDQFIIDKYKMLNDPKGVGVMVDNPNYSQHHAHVSVRKNVLDTVKFREEHEFYRMEDSIFGNDLLAHNISIGHISNNLSRYLY
jgi:glycosyltransferase involved in cell wall biosynthesis